MVNRIPRLVFIKITGYDAGSMIKLSENKRIHRAQCVHMTHYFQSTVRGLATLFQPFSASAHTVSSMGGHAHVLKPLNFHIRNSGGFDLLRARGGRGGRYSNNS